MTFTNSNQNTPEHEKNTALEYTKNMGENNSHELSINQLKLRSRKVNKPPVNMASTPSKKITDSKTPSPQLSPIMGKTTPQKAEKKNTKKIPVNNNETEQMLTKHFLGDFSGIEGLALKFNKIPSPRLNKATTSGNNKTPENPTEPNTVTITGHIFGTNYQLTANLFDPKEADTMVEEQKIKEVNNENILDIILDLKKPVFHFYLCRSFVITQACKNLHI